MATWLDFLVNLVLVIVCICVTLQAKYLQAILTIIHLVFEMVVAVIAIICTYIDPTDPNVYYER